MKTSTAIFLISATIIMTAPLQPALGIDFNSPYLKDYSMEVTPENPGPNQETKISVKSYAFDLQRIYFTWSINGKKIIEGLGRKDFDFKTGNAGEQIIVSLNIRGTNGRQYEEKVTFRPMNVSLFWEADTYTPINYRGKALASEYSKVKVVAVPEIISGGKIIPPSELFYDWEIDYKKMGNVSGYGKNKIEVRTKQEFDELPVKVIVTNFEKTIMASAFIKIPARDTKVLFYKKSPLEGTMLASALPLKFNLSEEEIIMKAEPFFFSKNVLSNLSFSWTMNGKRIPDEKKDSLTLRKGEGEGTAMTKIETFVSNPNNPNQSSSRKIEINYEL